MAAQGRDTLAKTRALRKLPHEWADGFPRLRVLAIRYQELGGSLTPSWHLGGFPAIVDL